MKDMFKGFYETPNKRLEDIWNNPSTLFVFDTNVLLNLYSYAEKTRDDFFNLIEKSIVSNIWIPYHVGLEYQRNRLKIIKEEKKVFNDINIYLSNIEKALKSDSINNLKLAQRLPNIKEKTDDLHKKILLEIDLYKNVVEEQNKKHPDVRSEDKVRKKIDQLFSLKIGDKPISQDWLEAIYTEGKERYKNNIPPGYKDIEKEKEDNFYYANLTYIPMYGDLIIWKQLLEKANEDNIKSVIFISDDIKEDWRFSINSNGPKLMGARAELREEIFRKSNIEDFMILTTFEFMEKAKKASKIDVDKNTIKEIEKTFNKNKNKIFKNKLMEEISKIDDLNLINIEQTNPNYRLIKESANRHLDKSFKVSDKFREKYYKELDIHNSDSFRDDYYKKLGIHNLDSFRDDYYKKLDIHNSDSFRDDYYKKLGIHNSDSFRDDYYKKLGIHNSDNFRDDYYKKLGIHNSDSFTDDYYKGNSELRKYEKERKKLISELYNIIEKDKNDED